MHDKEQEYEKAFWGDCTNTYDEETKQYVYASLMGLKVNHYSIDMQGKQVVDIGGGPSSLLLKCNNLGTSIVVDPLKFPLWVTERYKEKKVEYIQSKGEDMVLKGFDEVWIYNCLQHVENPEKIISNALEAAPVLRIFEWVDIPPHPGHPHELTKFKLDNWIDCNGKQIKLQQNGCYGTAYYAVKENIIM